MAGRRQIAEALAAQPQPEQDGWRQRIAKALSAGADYTGRGLAVADLYSGGMLSSVAGLNPFGSHSNVMAARDKALEGVPREMKALATEPINPMAAIFAGPMARTANKAMLRRAEDLAGQNAPREQIWNETGWFKGPDQKWRFEIDDSQSYVTPERSLGFAQNRADVILGRPDIAAQMPDKGWGSKSDLALDHPLYYGAYPDARDQYTAFLPKTSASMKNYLGRYDGSSVSVMKDAPRENMRSTLLHEHQHRVQDKEGFARGGNLEMFAGDAAQSKAYDHAWIVANRIKNLGETPEQASMYLAGAPDGIGDAVKLRDLATRYSQDELLALANTYKPENRYRALAGETEARAVQKRMNLTSEQRRARAPWLDYDVPEEQQILRSR
jgi:hypothetical protein